MTACASQASPTITSQPALGLRHHDALRQGEPYRPSYFEMVNPGGQICIPIDT